MVLLVAFKHCYGTVVRITVFSRTTRILFCIYGQVYGLPGMVNVYIAMENHYVW